VNADAPTVTATAMMGRENFKRMVGLFHNLIKTNSSRKSPFQPARATNDRFPVQKRRSARPS
jgi:hypothetical protein